MWARVTDLGRITLRYTRSSLFHASVSFLRLSREEHRQLKLLHKAPSWSTPAQVIQERAFSSWDDEDVKTELGVAKISAFPTKDVPPELVKNVLSHYNTQKACRFVDHTANEATRRPLIGAILLTVPLYTSGKLKIEDEASHGVVDFCVGPTRDQPFLLVEAKTGDLQQGIAQNMLELECASKIQNGIDVYGVVSDGFQWLFIAYRNGKFFRTPEFTIETDLASIVGTLCWIADQWKESENTEIDPLLSYLSPE